MPLKDTVVFRGTVFDSLSRTHLAGANVQLVGADTLLVNTRFAARTDSAGAFVLSRVPTGRYIVGFYHPAFDSLGLEVTDRLVDIRPGEAPIVLTTPSVATLMSTLCGATTRLPIAPGAPGLLLGRVRDAQTESAVAGGSVVASWPDVDIASGRVGAVTRTATTATLAAGWFALCGPPVGVPVSLVAAGGADSSDAIEVMMPPSGIAHLTLLLGRSQSRDGRIIGTIVDQAQRPVAAARISLLSEPSRQVSSSEAGRFVLDSVPPGTRTISIRAIGYAPITAVVNVSSGTATTTQVALERVTALAAVVTRDSIRQAHFEQFLYERRSDASGSTFVEPVRLEGYEPMQSVCQITAGIRHAPRCRIGGAPRACEGFVLNGQMVNFDFDDLDPADIIGVVVYRRLPERFSRPRLCAIGVWTRCQTSSVPMCQAQTRPSKVVPPSREQREKGSARVR